MLETRSRLPHEFDAVGRVEVGLVEDGGLGGHIRGGVRPSVANLLTHRYDS